MVLLCTFFLSFSLLLRQPFLVCVTPNSTSLMEHKFNGNITRINESFSYSTKALPCQVDQKLMLLLDVLDLVQRFNCAVCNHRSHRSSNLRHTSHLQLITLYRSCTQLQPLSGETANCPETGDNFRGSSNKFRV